MIRILFLSATALLLWQTHGQADPLPCSGVCTNSHDPSIIRRDSDGRYFRFSTGGKVAIHTAPSLDGPWTYQCAMLPSGSVINNPGRNDIWAPDAAKVGDTYYIYYSVSTFGSQNSAIGFATSPTMDCNSFNDHGSVVTSYSGSRFNTIDGNLFFAGGKYYLNFGSFWDGLYQVEMANPPTAAVSAPRQITYEPSGSRAIEAPFMIFNNNYYYLFFSNGVCCGYDSKRPPPGEEYKVKVCRSPSATAGFVDKNGRSCTSGGGTVILGSHGNIYGPGGQGIYNDPINSWIIYYHYVDTRIGFSDGAKRFGWNKINWVDGWPSV
ncbi:glycoside hydrolase family 43 protein [Patellaria atrata CBS 101060]|uniref:Arabinan endo-1,5-alpha-L-arabinosidase n=1 Tax=Patellaria atrata CBS 101060 TaxID=1346257 RepID=A0A9P4S5D7_9PEZI|nr:glycoside hydrolase family 43 protein [Patellaria atrata CBS 101060]